MAEYDPYAGRRPALGLHGQVRGLRSRPGAPLAQPNLNQTGQGYGSTPRGITPISNWESLFKNRITGANSATGQVYTPPGAQGGTGDPAGGAGVAGPTGGGASLETLASGGVMPHTQRWSTNPPPFSQQDTSMPGNPFMPHGPGTPFFVPKPLTSPTGNAATDQADLQQAQGMYAPGAASGFQGAPSANNWQGPTTPVRPGNYTTPYGSASVSSDQTVKGSYGWGDSFRSA